MKNETKIWMAYAEENLKSAQILMDSSLFNSCLQNIQQSIEKFLKDVLVEFSGKFLKTHSISRLMREITDIDQDVSILEDECDLLDTIYMPSKYPLSSAIPDYDPDIDICRECLEIAHRVEVSVKNILFATQ